MPKGFVTTYEVDEKSGLILGVLRSRRPNQIQHSWGWIACQLFGKGLSRFKINTIYIEFANVASPGDPVALPEFAKGDGLEYYTGLSGSRDYLRMRIPEPAVEIASGFEAFFEEGVTGNKLIFMGQTSGLVGMNGLTFSDAANSTVYGLALVAAPVREDRSQDVIFGRAYYAAENQMPKNVGRQIAVSWEQEFTELA